MHTNHLLMMLWESTPSSNISNCHITQNKRANEREWEWMRAWEKEEDRESTSHPSNRQKWREVSKLASKWMNEWMCEVYVNEREDDVYILHPAFKYIFAGSKMLQSQSEDFIWKWRCYLRLPLTPLQLIFESVECVSSLPGNLQNLCALTASTFHSNSTQF